MVFVQTITAQEVFCSLFSSVFGKLTHNRVLLHAVKREQFNHIQQFSAPVIFTPWRVCLIHFPKGKVYWTCVAMDFDFKHFMKDIAKFKSIYIQWTEIAKCLFQLMQKLFMVGLPVALKVECSLSCAFFFFSFFFFLRRHTNFNLLNKMFKQF